MSSISPRQQEHEVMGKLLRFLEVDDKSKETARELHELFAAQADEIVDQFYREIRAAGISSHITDEALACLKPKQMAHWAELFNSEFGDDYMQRSRRRGIRHRDIALNPLWYVAGYAKLAIEFLKVIAASDLAIEKKIDLIITLQKYVAIDMAFALSTYDATIVD